MTSRGIIDPTRFANMNKATSVWGDVARLEEARRLASFGAEAYARTAGVVDQRVEVGLKAAVGLRPDVGAEAWRRIAESQAINPTPASRLQSVLPQSVERWAGIEVAGFGRVSDQWKPALMRWSMTSKIEVIERNRMELARAVSQAVMPQVGWAAAQAARDLRRSPLLGANTLGTEQLVTSFPLGLPEIPTEWPETEPEPQEDSLGSESAPAGSDVVSERESELFRRIEALERDLASQRRPFVVRLGEKVVVGLLVKVLWEQTPIGDYTAVVIDKLEVVIDGATYVLPYIPFP